MSNDMAHDLMVDYRFFKWMFFCEHSTMLPDKDHLHIAEQKIIWNELSDDLKSLTSVKAFKAHLIKHILNVNNVNLNIQF